MKILDMSAGNRAIWLDKDCELATFLDRRPEAKADFVCDTRSIPDEVGKDFALIVFDPPHENVGPNSRMATFYGHSTRPEIFDTVKGSAAEAWRVSRPDALMAFKWNDCAKSLDFVLELMAGHWRPLFGHHMRNRGGASAKSQTYWVMLLRKSA